MKYKTNLKGKIEFFTLKLLYILYIDINIRQIKRKIVVGTSPFPLDVSFLLFSFFLLFPFFLEVSLQFDLLSLSFCTQKVSQLFFFFNEGWIKDWMPMIFNFPIFCYVSNKLAKEKKHESNMIVQVLSISQLTRDLKLLVTFPSTFKVAPNFCFGRNVIIGLTWTKYFEFIYYLFIFS